MRLPLFICFILSSIFSLAQKKDTLVKYLDKNFGFTGKPGMAYPGVAFPEDDHWVFRSFYPDKSPLIEAAYLDKKLTIKDGRLIANYPTGTRALEGAFTNNQRKGVWRSWYKNGQLKDSGYINQDQLTGTWITWHDNGKMMTRAHFTNEAHSSTNSLVISPQKVSLLEFPEPISIKSGTWETWSKNGRQVDSGNFEKNYKTGFWKSWYENGNLESEGAYDSKGNFQGAWIFYREDGMLSTKEKYAEGKLSDLQCFDEKGNPAGSFCSIAKPPVLLGTPYDWKLFIDTHLDWSKETIRNGREGTTTIRFFISKEGKLTRHQLLNSPDPLVSKDIEKVLLLMKEWSPAILHNRPFEYSFEYSIPFYP